MDIFQKIEKSGVEIVAALANLATDAPTEALGSAGIPVSILATEVINGAKEAYYKSCDLN